MIVIHKLTCLPFQSSIDLACAFFLLLYLGVKDLYKLHNGGWFGEIECRLWNSEAFLWASFGASASNLLFLTIERYVLFLYLV